MIERSKASVPVRSARTAWNWDRGPWISAEATSREYKHKLDWPVDLVLNVANVAKPLGVCTATVYKLCATGALPHVRVLNSIRIEEVALRAFIAAQRRRSSAARIRG